jgi:hypothetical protein
VTAVVIVAVLLVAAGVVAWFLVARKVPEQAASHADDRNTARPEVVAERPAGADAESMAPNPPTKFVPPDDPSAM